MRFNRSLALAGLATALAGVTAVSAAERQPVHVMTVQLPGGGIEQVRYTGDAPPRILVRDDMAPMMAASFLDTAFGPDLPFAELDRISAEMDRQAAMMMHQAALMQSMPDAQLQQAVMAGAPAGATSFTMISTSTGNGTCSQSVRTVSLGMARRRR